MTEAYLRFGITYLAYRCTNDSIWIYDRYLINKVVVWEQIEKYIRCEVYLKSVIIINFFWPRWYEVVPIGTND